MTGPSDNQLRHWQEELEKEIGAIDLQIRPLESRKRELQARLQAVCLALPKNGSTPATALPAPVQRSVRAMPDFTPVQAYWKPTLQTLVEMGGAGPSDVVIQSVGKKLESILTDADRDVLPSGVDIRWRNRVAFQRENMKRRGLLRHDSPRGIWEITESGRKWLSENT